MSCEISHCQNFIAWRIFKLKFSVLNRNNYYNHTGIISRTSHSQSNHEHLFLQSEECLYLNTGDMVSETNQTVKNYSGVVDGIELNAFGESPVGHSTLISNKHWQIIQVRWHSFQTNLTCLTCTQEESYSG